MKMAFIGAGKVGKSLGLYFKNAGFSVSGYSSRTIESAKAAAELTGTEVFTDLTLLVQESDLLWITTSDMGIKEVANSLLQTSSLTPRHIILHTSGALSSLELESLKEIGCGLFSVHPLQSFHDPVLSQDFLPQTIFTVEGTVERMVEVMEIFQRTGNQVVTINPDRKGLYHAGACIISNYWVTLLDVAGDLLVASGIEPLELNRVMLPLIQGTLNNVLQKGTKQALTGPLQRGDGSTIQKHLEIIGEQLPEHLDFYRSLGLKTLAQFNQYNNASLQRILKEEE